MKPPLQPTAVETDPRFPSGRWTGFFLQKARPGRHQMELLLTFANGVLVGEGRDWVGKFVMRGRYDLADGRCYWSKRYLGQHDVHYTGFNEGKGIWGTWEIPGELLPEYRRGGFHIWPEGMADPTGSTLTEEADLPAVVVTDELQEVEVGKPVGVPSRLLLPMAGTPRRWASSSPARFGLGARSSVSSMTLEAALLQDAGQRRRQVVRIDRTAGHVVEVARSGIGQLENQRTGIIDPSHGQSVVHGKAGE